MKDGKYHVFIDGKERTIDADKFENNYEAIVGRYPEAKIRVSRENQLGDIPLKNYRKAIGSNRYKPYISMSDEAKEANKKNIQPEISEDRNLNNSVQQSPVQVPLPDKPVSSTKSSVQPTNSSTPSANKSILYANNPDIFTNTSVPFENNPASSANDPVPSANEPDPTIPIARFIKGKGKDKTVFGIPYEIYERMKPETKYYYYQQAVDAEKNANRKVIESQINATRGEVSKDIQAEYLKDTEARMKFQREHPVQSAIQDMAYGSRFARTGIDTSNPMFTNSKIKALNATANRLDDAKEVLDESKKKGKTNFVMGSFRGLGKSLSDARTWDSGIIGGLDNSAILSAIDATENGKADVVQQRLLDAAAIEMAVNQEFGDDIGRGYKAGKVTGESVPFMIEFMTNPASGMGKSVTKTVVKRGIEKFGKDAMRTGLKKMQMSALRAGADALGAGTMSLTTGMGRVAEDAERRMIGTIRPILDENGYIRYGGAEGGESFGKDLIKAYGAITIENYSEMLGNYFEPMFSVASNATAKGLSKIGLGKVNDVISNIKASDWAKSISAFEKQAQWNGTIGEYAEEVAGNVLNSIFVGDQTLDTNPETGVFNLNNNIDTFLGVSIMGGFLSSLKTGGYMAHKYTAGKRLKKAESNGEHVFENKEQWESVRESINNANEEGIVLMLEDVYHSDDYTPEQKKAVFTYAAALKGYQGANLADLRRHTDGDVPPAQLEAEGAFDEGYSLNEPQEKNEAKLTLDQSIADVQKGLGLSNEEDAVSVINEMGDSPAQILMTMDERGYPQESIRSVSDYLNAKARYDGMIESAKDGIEGEIESQVQYIDKNTHKDGNLYSATMKMGDRKVYVTGGNVAIQEDGLVDHEKSDKSIIIGDAETGKIEMVDVRDLLSVQPGISAESHKLEISEQIRQDYAQRASDEINGVLAFAPGDVYAVLNPESGVREELTVLQADGDIAIVSDGAGEQMEIAKGELQSLVDQERMSRIQEKRQAMQSDAEEELPSGQEDLPVEQGDTPDENKEAGVSPTTVVKVLEDGRTAVLTASDDKEATFDIYDLHGELEDSDDMPLDEFYKLQDYVEEPDVELDDDGFPISENRTEEPVLPENNNEEPASLSVPQESENAIPVDENGNTLYHKIPVEKTIADINDGSLEPEEVDAFVSANKKEAEKLLKKIATKSPKVSTDKAKYLAEKQAWQENMTEAQARVDYWNEVETQIQTSRIQPGDKTVEEIAAMGEPVSGEEFVAMMLGKGKLPLLYDDYKRETGFSNNEARGMFGLFAGRDKGGMTIEEAGEKLMEMDEANGTNFFDQTDANAGRDAIIDLLSSVKTRGGLINLIKNNREKMAERERQAEVEADEIAKEQWYQDNAHMTPEEHELWSQGELLSESNVYSVDEDVDFYNNFADDILKENSYDSRRERIDGQGADIGESHEQGRVLEPRDESHEILQGEEIVPAGRVEGHQGESGKVEERSSEILHPANDGLQDSPSGRNGGIDESVPETENLPSSLNSEGDGTFPREQENVSLRKDGELATFEKTGPTPDGKITDTAETHKELQSDTALLQDNGSSTSNNKKGEDNKQDKGGFVSPPRLDGESLQDYAVRIDDAYLIHREEQKANTNPTEAQKKAGNYKKAHIKVDGFDITIENPKGSERRGVDDKGKPWSVTMNNSYGYIRGTEGVDGDHIDFFMGDTGDGVYVVDQVKEDGTFDEHKVMYGFGSLDEAKEAYLANYSPGWKGLGNITGVSKEAFKKWVDSSHRKTKPFAEYKKIERLDGQSENSESLSKDVAKELGENLNKALHLYGDVSLVSSEKVLDMARKLTSSEEEAIKLNRSDVEKFISLYRDGYEKSAEMLKKQFGIEIPDAKDMVEQIYAARNGDVYKNKFAIIKILGSNILNYSEALEEMERVENSTESYKKYKAPGAAFSRQQKDYRKAKGDVEYYRARISGDIEEYKKEVTEKHGTDLQENSIRFRESDPQLNKGDITEKYYVPKGYEPSENNGFFLRFTDTPILDIKHGKSRWYDSSLSDEEAISQGYQRDPSAGWYWEHSGLSGHYIDASTLSEAIQKVEEQEWWFRNSKEDSWSIFEDNGDIYVNQDTPEGDTFAPLKVLYSRFIEGSTTQDERINENDDIRFREIKEKDGSKSLIGLHNISEDKLSKALKLGGLANPSAAVIDVERQTHDGYGEISLILPSSMIAKSTGRNAGTFSGDAWTPVYPQIERQFADEESSSRVYDDISKLPQEMHSVVRSAWNSYMDGRDADALAYQFLHEKGKVPELREKKSIFSEDIRKKVIEADAMDDYDDRNKAILDAYIDERFDGDRAKFEDYVETRKRVLQKKIDDIPSQKGLAYRKAVENLSDIEERGYEYNSIKKFYDEVISDIRRSGSVDTNQTVQDALDKINQSPKLREEYEKWKEKLADKYGINEVLFKGYTPSGERIYLPHTLENVSKIMKQQGLAGATGWGGSFSKFAAGLMKSVGTLSGIRRQKGKLTTNHDDIETFREKWGKVYFDLGLKLNPDARGFDDSGLYRVEEIATKSNPKSFAKREYGVDLSDEDVQQLNTMVEAIRDEYPAMYFETKYERPVMLNEFAGAVVPDNVDEEITAAMEKAGLRLFKYKAGDELSRNKALKQASGIEGVRFRTERDGGVIKENYDRAYRVIDDFKEKNAGAVEAFVIYSPETLREQLTAKNFTTEDIDKYEGWLKEGQTPAIYSKHNEGLIIILDTNVSPEELNAYLWHEHTHKAFDEIYEASEKQRYIDQLYNDLLPYAEEDFADIRRSYSDETEDVQKEECLAWFVEKSYKYYGERQGIFIDGLINNGIDSNGTIKDIYNYIHHGTRREEFREHVEGGDGRRVENDAESGGKGSVEMRNAVPRDGIAEESGSSRNELSGLREAGTGEKSQRSRKDGRGSRNDFRGILEVREGEIPQSTEERGNGSKTGRELRVRLPDGRNYIVFDENDLEIVDQKRFRESDKDKKMRQTKNTFKTYHGSGAAFDQFDASHTGEGQGESMVGRGVYTSKSKKIAEKYADVAKNKDVFGNKYLYEVRIPVDNGSNYLDYDKLYDAKELDAIATRMQDAGVDVKDAFDKYLNGRIAYGQIVIKVIAWCLPENADVNKILSKAGYVGCKYSTKHDIGKNERSNKKSYVVFDEDNASIIKRNQIESHAKKMSDLLRSPIKIIRSIDELDNSVVKRAIQNGRNVKGWYDTNSGEVVLYLPNATSAEDIQATVLHEVVAHHGLRKLFGEDFDKELMNIYEMLPEDVRKDIATDALRNYGSDLIIATEEYLARQAEKNEMPGWWNRVVSSFKDFLRKMGISLEISDNDVRYLLWKSYQNLKGGNGILEQAQDIAFQMELGVGRFRKEDDVKVNKEKALNWSPSASQPVQQEITNQELSHATKIVESFESENGLIRFRDTGTDDLFANEQNGDNTDKNTSLLDAYKNRILELNGRIASLERKIDSHITAEELSNEVIEEIKKEIGSDIMSEIGKKDLSSLLHQVQNAKTKKSLEKIFMNVKRVALAAQARKLQRVMDKLLALKVQDVNGKNMSIAKNVDDSTRRIFSFIRGKLSDMKKSGLEEDIMYLKRENRNHREEIARLERTLRESKDAKTKDEAISAIETHKKTIEVNKERIKELTQEKNEIEKVVANAGDLDVENEMAALNEKMDRAAQDKAVWTQSDSERMAALNIISGQLMNKKHDFEIQSIESDIKQRILENADRYRDRRKEVSENKRRQITNAINENRRQIVALNRLINDTRSTQAQQLQMTIEQLEELINNGKNSLLRRTEEEAKRKNRIIGQSLRTIEGKPIDIYDKESDKESLLKKFFSAPLGSFEYMCKRVNTKTLGKDGFLYKYFIKGNDGVMKAYDTYILGMEEFRDRIDEKSIEIFGKKYSKIWSLSDKVENESGVHFIDTNNGQRYGKRHSVTNKGYGVRYEVPLSKGQAMYIYQVWKMNDGRTKLELQGIDEESIAEIRDFLGEKYIKFADWIQEELLPETREKYNAKYIEMHGTSLTAIKDYVPLRIIKKSIREESDLSDDKAKKKTLEERAGSLINRVVNTNPVDITMSAFDVLYEHGRQMEEWNAYARVRRDLDAILSNTTFKNQLNANTRGSFGNFYDAAAVATSAYHPDQNKYMDEILGKLSKGIVGGNIAWRLSTALKQILSAPAFLGYSQSPLYMKALISNLAKMPVTFKWCMENIPSFRERVTKGTAGNEKLDEKSISKYLDKYIETGMIPNKLVDAVTCSIGAKSIFDYKYGLLLKSGLTEEEARNQALADADIYYNQTQQSSHPAFLSPMQMSRSIMDRMVTTYQNSNIGYVRKVLSAYYDLTRSLKWKELEKNYTDMFMEEGISRDEAARMAYRRLLNENKKTAFEIILFGWGMNLLWNMGSKGLLGLFAGDDDDDNWAKGISFFLTSPIKGMPGGNLLASIASGYGMNPVLVYDELDKFMKEINLAIDEYGLISPEIAYATLEKASRYGGVDLEVLGNIYLGVEGLARDGALSDDKMIDLMFILNSPKSNRVAVAKNLYKDESVFSFAEKVARANKYISKRDPWEGWVPGVKEPTKRRLKEIEKSYNRLQMTDDEKKIEDEKKIADKHRRKLKELKDNPFDLADYIDSHMEQHKIYQKYY